MPRSADDRRLRRYLSVWRVAGAVTLLVTLGSTWWDPGVGLRAGTLLAVPAVVLLAALSDAAPLEARLGRSVVSINLYEAAAMLAVVLLPPSLVAVSMTVGVAVSQRRLGVSWEKASFNLSFIAVGSAAAAGVVVLTGVGVDPLVPAGIANLVLAGTVFGVINLLALVGLLRRLEDDVAPPVGRRFVVESGFALGVSISLALLVAVVLRASPWVLPLLIVPIVVARRAAAAGARNLAREAAHRDRLERTIAGTADGICLLDAHGVVELCNPPATRLLERPRAEVLGRHLGALLRDLRGASTVAEARVEARVDELLRACTPDGPQGEADIVTAGRVVGIEVTGLFDAGTDPTGFVVVLRDVTESRERESVRREFVARVSHELRTPLTAIQGFTETLHTHLDELSPERRSEYLEVIRRQGRRLERLVDDLLWSARLEADTAAVRPQVVDLESAVHESALALSQMDGWSPPRIEVTGIRVRADPVHVEQIVTNLLANAVIYGAAPIAVDGRVEGDTVTLEISDGGRGVPPAFVDELFLPFSQASRGDTREATGLGLGLAIVSSLLERNGGSIVYERVAGRTVFRLTLPAG